jgi:hypothetical protein
MGVQIIAFLSELNDVFWKPAVSYSEDALK